MTRYNMTIRELVAARGLVAARARAKEQLKAWTDENGSEERAKLLAAANQTNSAFLVFFEKYGDELVALALRTLGRDVKHEPHKCACGHPRNEHLRGPVTGCGVNECDCQEWRP